MNGSEEYERWMRAANEPAIPPEPEAPDALPVAEPLEDLEPLEELGSLEEISSLEVILGGDDVLPLEEVQPGAAIPYAILHHGPPWVQPAGEPLLVAESPLPVVSKAGRGFTILSWLVIVALVGFVFFTQHIWPAIEKYLDDSPAAQNVNRGSQRTKPGGVPIEFEDGEERKDGIEVAADLESATFLLQGRYFVGLNNLFKQAGFYEGALSLNEGSPNRRLRFVALAGELAGPAEALSQLDRLERESTLSSTQKRVANALRPMYRDFQQRRFLAPSLAQTDRQLLKQQLGWFGDLALTPEDSPDSAARSTVINPARLTAILTVTFVLLVIGLMGVGLILLIIFLSCLFAGYLRPRFGRFGPYGGVYAETFALWMLAFVGQNFLLGFLEGAGVFAGFERSMILFSGLLDLGTLAVIFWPVIRGVPWREMRHDLGLTWGRKPLREPFVGLGCYVMSLPLLGLGAIVTAILMYLSGQWPGSGGATLHFALGDTKPHPAFELAAQGDWWIKAQVVFLAVIVAPILEEILFRGVLYRHLRDLSGRVGFAMSVILSAGVSSIVFAVIHPQDPLAFPVLMGLASGFALTREWRGSLVSCMVMHGVHNGWVSVLFLTVVSMQDKSGMF